MNFNSLCIWIIINKLSKQLYIFKIKYIRNKISVFLNFIYLENYNFFDD